MAAPADDTPPGFEPLPSDDAPPGYEPMPSQAEVDAERDQRLESILRASWIGEPDREGAIYRLAKESGVAPDTIRTNFDSVKSAWDSATAFRPSGTVHLGQQQPDEYKSPGRLVRENHPEVAKLLLDRPELAWVRKDVKVNPLMKALHAVQDFMFEAPIIGAHNQPFAPSEEEYGKMKAERDKPRSEVLVQDEKAKEMSDGWETFQLPDIGAYSQEHVFGVPVSPEQKAERDQQNQIMVPRRAMVPFLRAQETWDGLALSRDYAKLKAMRWAGADTQQLEIDILRREQESVRRDYDEGPIEQIFSDMAEGATSSAAAVERGAEVGGPAAAIAGTVTALGSLALTRNPAISGEVGKDAAVAVGSFFGKAGMALGTFELESGSAYQQMLRDGIDEPTARVSSEVYGLLSTATEFASWGPMFAAMGPLGAMLKTGDRKAFSSMLLKSTGFRAAMKRAMASAGAEMGEEFLQDATQQAVEYFARANQPGGHYDTKSINLDQSFEAAAKAAPFALATGGVESLVGHISNSIALDRMRVAGKQVASIAGLKDSPSATYAPEAVAQMVSDATAESGRPVTHLYLDAPSYVRYYQDNDVDPNVAAREHFGEAGPRLLQEALSTGAKLEMPLETYVGKFGVTDAAQAFVEDTTTRPDHLTPRQLGEMDKRADELAKQYEKEITPTSASEAVFTDALTKQLMAVVDENGKRRYNAKTARTAVAPIRAFLRVQSEALGQDVDKAFADMAISVSGGTLDNLDTSFDFGANEATPQDKARSEANLKETMAGIARMGEEKQAMANAWLDYARGKTKVRPHITPELEKHLARRGFVDPAGFTYEENGRSMERALGGRRKHGEEPDELRRIRMREMNHKMGYFSQDPHTLSAMRRAFEKLDPTDQQSRFFHDRNTKLLNERGFAAAPKDPNRQTLAIFEFEGQKHFNDVHGHLTFDGALRLGAEVLKKRIPDGMQSGGTLRAWVADVKQARAISAEMSKATGVRVTVGISKPQESLAKTFDAADKAGKTYKDSERSAKRLAERGAMPAGMKESGTVAEKFKAAPEGKAVALGEQHGASFEAQKRNAFDIIHRESTGLLTDEGFRLAREVNPQRFVVSGDLRGLAPMNKFFTRKGADVILRIVSETLARKLSAFDAAHPHGDEFYAQANDGDALETAFGAVQKALDKLVFFREQADGRIAILKGLQFAHGIADGQKHADPLDHADRVELPRVKEQQGANREPVVGEADVVQREIESLRRGGHTVIGLGDEALADDRRGAGEDTQGAGQVGRLEHFHPPSQSKKLFQPGIDEKGRPTSAFKAWFKDSKVVDENGKPLVVYHGTSGAGFDQFDLSKQDRGALYGPGFYFTADPSVASEYTDKGNAGSAGVYPVFLSIQNPLNANNGADAKALLPQLRKFKAKLPPPDIKRMIDTALRDESENFTVEGLGAWVDNTEWAYRIADQAGKNGEELLAPHWDYILSKARDYIVKKIGLGPKGFWLGSDVLYFIDKNVMRSMQPDQQNIREVLEAFGFDGISHTGGGLAGGGEKLHQVWIAFHPTQVKSATGNSGAFDSTNPNILFAGEPENPRGYTEILRNGMERIFKVALNSNADMSTWLHETGHIFLELFADLAERPDAPARIKNDWGATMKWLGVAHRTDITTKEHEKWARGFERYLMEGKSPSPKLEAAFFRFKQWLTEVYQSIAELHVDMSDEIRGVFDRLLATDKEIGRMSQKMGLGAPMAADVLNMTPEEYQQHLDERDAALSHTQRSVELRAMKDKLRETESWWKEEEAKEREVAAEEYEQLRARKTQRILRGQAVDGLRQEPIGLDRAAVEAAIGKENGKKVLLKKNGVKPDDIAEGLGYQNGKAMLDDIAGLADRTTWVKARGLERMAEKHPDVLEDRVKLRELVSKGLHGELTLRWLLKEWAALKQKVSPPNTPAWVYQVSPAQAMEKAARLYVEKRAISRLDPGHILSLERNEADAAAKAAAKGDYGRAFIHKQRQLMNMYVWRELTQAREQRESFYDLAAEMGTENARKRLGKGRPIYRDGADLVLETLSLKEASPREKPLPSIAEVAAAIEADGGTVGFDVELLGRLLLKPSEYKNLTVAQMREVDATLRNIRGAATAHAMAIVDDKRLDKEEVIAQLLEEARRNLPDLGPVSSSKSAESAWQAFKSGLASLDGSLLKLETMIRWLGGRDLNSMWVRAVLNPIQNAKGREVDLLKKTIAPVLDAFEKMPKSVRARFMESVDGNALFPQHRTDLSPPTKRFEILMMALNAGNESSLVRLLDGRSISLAQLHTAINLLTKEEMDWVQSVWDACESLWPESRALEERDSGLAPPKLERRALVTPHGTYSGGYFPAVYDKRVENAGERQEIAAIAAIFDPGYTRPGTPHSHLKSRVDGFSGAIALEPSVIARHLTQVAHDIAFREALKSVAGLVLDKDVQNIIRQRLGDERSGQFLTWLKDVGQMRAAESLAHTQQWMRIARGLKGNIVTAALGYSVPNAIEDLSNLPAAVIATDLKAKHLAAAVLQMGKSPRQTIDAAESLSAELRTRRDQMQRELMKQIRDLTSSGALALKTLRFLKDHAFVFMEFSDRMSATAIWTGRYRQALADGLEQDAAVKVADAVVRQVLPSHSAVDRASILRDKGYMGSVTMFYGFFSTAYNNVRDITHDLHTAEEWTDKAKALPRVSARLLAYMSVVAVLSELLRGRGRQGDEEWDEWYLRKLFAGTMSLVPFGGDVGNAVEAGVLHKDPNPRARSMASVAISLGVALHSLPSEDKDGEQKAKALLRSIGPVIGLPVSQPLRTGGYLYDMLEGDVDPRGAGDVAGGLLFGQSDNTPAANLGTMIQDAYEGAPIGSGP